MLAESRREANLGKCHVSPHPKVLEKVPTRLLVRLFGSFHRGDSIHRQHMGGFGDKVARESCELTRSFCDGAQFPQRREPQKAGYEPKLEGCGSAVGGGEGYVEAFLPYPHETGLPLREGDEYPAARGREKLVEYEAAIARKIYYQGALPKISTDSIRGSPKQKTQPAPQLYILWQILPSPNH